MRRLRPIIFAPLVFAMLPLALVPPAAAQDARPWMSDMVVAMKALGSKNYAAAEQAYLRALREAETFAPNDARRGSTLNSLGLVYRAEKKYSESEAAYRRALPIMQAAFGDSVDVANVNFNIAGVLFDEGREADAMPNLEAARATYEKLLGANSLKTAAVLCLQGDANRAMKHYREAEALLRRCSDIREADSGVDSSDLADAQYSLALAFMAEGKYSAAEPRLQLVEKIREKTLGITSLLLAQTMEDHALVLKQLGRDHEAAKLTTIAAAIRRSQK
jgi:tetratricopeptide (TPR) repeat protein